MRIERSAAILTQLQLATAVRTSLMKALTQALGDGTQPRGKGKAGTQEPTHPLIQTLELSAEGFKPVVVALPISELDRTASMLAGPFFTSAENPIPITPDGMLMPIVQIDLRQIRMLNGFDLGDGLLQLWCDPDWENADRGMVFVIPREEVEAQQLTPFAYVPHPAADSSPAPGDLVFDPSATTVQVISGYESVGLQCQTSYLDVYSEDLPDDAGDSITSDIKKFQELTECSSELHFLGSFYPIQYSAADVGWNCLIHFPTWGSDGNAQIFYSQTERGMTFRFDESLR